MNENFQELYTLKKGLLLVVSGPSGAGKSKACQSYINRFPDTILSISETTREPRKGEKEGRDYYFISKDTFLNRLHNNHYLETAKNYDNYYGTPKAQILEALNQGKDVILEIDPQGAMQIKEQMPEAVCIFILPSSVKTLKEQLTGRKTESKEQVEIRLNNIKKEVSYVPDYDYVVINQAGRLTTTVTRIAAIVEAEKLSVKRILKENGELDHD